MENNPENPLPTPEVRCVEFIVDGMHCAACELLIEERIGKVDGVSSAKANLKNQKLIVEGVFSDMEKLAEDFTSLVQDAGYVVRNSISQEDFNHKINWEDFIISIPVALTIVTAFLIINRVSNTAPTSGNLNYWLIFFIGVIASLSSCMAVVGGLVLSISSNFSMKSRSAGVISQTFFHISRLISFFVLGGVLGLVGQQLIISTQIKFGIDVILFLIMLFLGINLLDLFPFMRKLQPTLPKFLFKKTEKFRNINNFLSPVLLGIFTFILPCGFTQQIQFVAFQSGNFINGALTMGIFALGTLPVLTLISFTSVKLSQTNFAQIFFKAAGLIVLFFAFYQFLLSIRLLLIFCLSFP